MYDELVKWLRGCGNDSVGCGDCPYKDGYWDGNCLNGLLTKAADAIEELSKRVPKAPHGRLIDADLVRNDIDEKRPGRSYEDAWALTIIDAAPTIISADPEEKEETT